MDTVITAYPSSNVDPKVKASKEYGLQVSEALLNDQRDLRWQWGGNDYMNFYSVMRTYLEGRQDPTQYEKRFRGTKKDGTLRRGYNNISMEIHPEARKHRSTLHSEIKKNEYNIQIESLSKQARGKKSYLKSFLWHDSQENALRQQVGVPLKNHYWTPESLPELAMYEKMGGFNLQFETGLSKMVENAFAISNWEDYQSGVAIDEMLLTSHVYARIHDNKDGSLGFTVIPALDFKTAYIKDETVEPPYAGNYEWMTMEELIPKLKEAYPGMTDEEILKIARSNFQNNKGYNLDNYVNRDPVTQRFPYYDMMVRVFRFYFKSIDTEYWTKTSDGKMFPEEYGKVVNKENKKTETYDYTKIYCGIRVCGFPYVVDYGQEKNLTFLPDGCPAFPYVQVYTGDISIVQAWKPWLDEIQMCVLKQRALRQSVKGEKTVFDVGILANMDFGHGILKGADVVQLAEDTGNVFIATRGDTLGRIDPKSGIFHIPPVGQQGLEVIQRQIDICTMQIQSLAGLTNAVAANPDQRPELVRLGEQEIAATQGALYVLISTYNRLKTRLAQKIAAKLIQKIKYVKSAQEYYSRTVGSQYVRAVMEEEAHSLNEIGTKIIAKPSARDKQFIETLLAESIKAGKNGYAGVSTSDAISIKNELENGNMQMAAWMLAVSEERAARKQAEERSAAAQETFQGQQQSAAVAEQQKQKTEQMKAQLLEMINGSKIQKQMEADLTVNQQQLQGDKEKIVLEKSLEGVNQPAA